MKLQSSRGDLMADAFQVLGFGLAVTGVGFYSIPLAFIVAGLVLFTVGGLAARK